MIESFLFSSVFLLLAAIIVDLVIGDPRWLPHPVIGIGKIITILEKRLNTGRKVKRRRKGVLLLFLTIAVVYGITVVMLLVAFKLHMIVGVVLEIYLISTTIAITGLRDAALRVAVPLSQGDLHHARHQLSQIVGRDTDQLIEEEIVRGTVETVAENTVDGVTAPLFWALIGGAPLALTYRAINTLDSMVGYKNEQYSDFGWASAKLDDLVNWLPARMTSLAIFCSSLFIKGSNRVQAIKITLRDANKHPSPNGGWTEAMVAGLIGIQVGGLNSYKGMISERAKMGMPMKKLEWKDIHKAISYMHGGWIVFYLILSLGYLLIN